MSAGKGHNACRGENKDEYCSLTKKLSLNVAIAETNVLYRAVLGKASTADVGQVGGYVKLTIV